ncbi:hypothetical protein E2C01_037540 [Portunus trituberculatus]|uniref:Uncharacterized protein n=1 Tax=Portunus trituberculatus TaxID=210409 RepID=A0A5B7FEV7_PORTR|nr:hypothetical protein [Portunus trituberculatus]
MHTGPPGTHATPMNPPSLLPRVNIFKAQTSNGLTVTLCSSPDSATLPVLLVVVAGDRHNTN